MSALDVVAIVSDPQTDDYGNLSYWVKIEGFEGNVLVSHKPDKPTLKAGDDATAFGFATVEKKTSKNGKAYNKLARPAFQGGGGGGGPRPEDPAKARAIQRMAAQKAAVALIHAKAQAGLATDEDFKPSKVAALADWFDADTNKARAA